MSKFSAEVVKRLEPKTKKEVATRIERLSKSAIIGQVSALENAVILKEIALEEAEESANAAFYPTTTDAVTNPQIYIENLVKARKHVTKISKELDETKALIETFKKDLASFEE